MIWLLVNITSIKSVISSVYTLLLQGPIEVRRYSDLVSILGEILSERRRRFTDIDLYIKYLNKSPILNI